jgi:DNA polymerase beta
MTTKPKITLKLKQVKEGTGTSRLIPTQDDFPLLDLRKDAGIGDDTDKSVKLNQHILKMLNDLIEVTIKQKSTADSKDRIAYGHKITSFTKGRDAINGYTKEITSGAQARKEIPGVGEGIAKRIDEFILTGKLKELELQHTNPEANIIMELTKVTGIGEVKARQLMENFGVTSVQDLIAKYNAGKIRVETNQLTHHIAVGLKFYHDLQLRMSWSEADQIAQRVKYLVHKFDPNLKVEICGSYRRKRETCGDIDVLVSNPTIKDMTLASTALHKIVSLMEQEGLLIGHLTSHGDTKYMGVCRANATGYGRRIDIRFIAYESMGAAILYFTGSGKFNKLMRFRANQRGYTLNEYGLFHYKNEIKGDQISTPTEQDVFATLRFLYLEPEQREF